MTTRILEALLQTVLEYDIIDTHEHLPPVERAREADTDVLCEYLNGYFSRDLISAGLGRDGLIRVRTPEVPLMERWLLVESFWESARRTGYGRNLDLSAKLLYGIDQINRASIEELNDKFHKSLRTGHFRYVLKEKSRIKLSILDRPEEEYDEQLFRKAFRLDHFVNPMEWAEFESIERQTGIRIASFDDWLDACQSVFNRTFDRGAVALKIGLAYHRPLRFSRVSKYSAENEFNAIFSTRHYPDWDRRHIRVGEAFQDYMVHFILNMANKRNSTVQIHTGLQEGNGNYIGNSDPTLLTNLFIEYPYVDFDLFHMGYPYQNTLCALAKNFPNVYIDMCWAHIISPAACVQALHDWIDAVPLNKISAFGGDHEFIDGVCGHQYMARLNVCKALAAKVEDGVMGMDEAKLAARRFLHDNPIRILKLDRHIS